MNMTQVRNPINHAVRLSIWAQGFSKENLNLKPKTRNSDLRALTASWHTVVF